MKKLILIAPALAFLAACQTVPDRNFARYEKIQHEVDAYYRCGEAKAWGYASTALRPRDIATGARSACGKVRARMIHKMQRCYPSPMWTRLTLDIEQTFRERAIARVFERRQELGMPTVVNWDL